MYLHFHFIRQNTDHWQVKWTNTDHLFIMAAVSWCVRSRKSDRVWGSERDGGQTVMVRWVMHRLRPVRVPMLTPCPLPKVPTLGTWASELDHRAMEEWGLVWWIMLSFTSGGWLGACALLTWGTPVTRMHYGKRASWWRQCDALGKVLLGNLESCL